MASSKSVVLAALVENGLIAITNFIGYLLTGSSPSRTFGHFTLAPDTVLVNVRAEMKDSLSPNEIESLNVQVRNRLKELNGDIETVYIESSVQS